MSETKFYEDKLNEHSEEVRAAIAVWSELELDGGKNGKARQISEIIQIVRREKKYNNDRKEIIKASARTIVEKFRKEEDRSETTKKIKEVLEKNYDQFD